MKHKLESVDQQEYRAFLDRCRRECGDKDEVVLVGGGGGDMPYLVGLSIPCPFEWALMEAGLSDEFEDSPQLPVSECVGAALQCLEHVAGLWSAEDGTPGFKFDGVCVRDFTIHGVAYPEGGRRHGISYGVSASGVLCCLFRGRLRVRVLVFEGPVHTRVFFFEKSVHKNE
jgi:hypothetical protein